MTVALAAGEVGRAPGSDGVEAEYVDPGRGRVRAPLAVCWPLPFERMSPVRGFASSRGQRNWPGWWWFSRTGTHVGYESWIAGCWIRPRWCGPPGVRGLMARHPVLRPGDTLRLGGETHTVAAPGSAMVVLADVTGAVREVPTAGLLADPGLELVSASRLPMAPQPALERLPAETVEAARWWERHLAEVITGVPAGHPPASGLRPGVAVAAPAGAGQAPGTSPGGAPGGAEHAEAVAGPGMSARACGASSTTGPPASTARWAGPTRGW